MYARECSLGCDHMVGSTGFVQYNNEGRSSSSCVAQLNDERANLERQATSMMEALWSFTLLVLCLSSEPNVVDVQQRRCAPRLVVETRLFTNSTSVVVSNDIKSMETKLEEFATKTVEDISDYFLRLHSYLQNKEKEILDKFAEQCQQPQFLLRQALAMRDSLEFYQRTLPPFVHVGKLLQRYNDRLYQMPYQVQLTKIRTNPFHNSVTDENLVRVTHVETPDNFYIQKVSDIEMIRQLSQAYLDGEQTVCIPKDLTIGYYYMVYHSTDKQWYRGMLKKILPNDVYRIFLIDFGLNLETSPDKLCVVRESHMRIPFAAVRCAIADIVPAEKEWSQAANSFLMELLQNQHARLARERPGAAHNFKMYIKEDLTGEKLAFCNDMNFSYGAQEAKPQQIYLAQANKCCAVRINDSWHRGRIMEVMGKGSLLIHLVDEGPCEIINWRQVFILSDEFRQRREYAIRCSLADIEPLQENSYNYTPAAIADFKQMTINPTLRMEVQSTLDDLNRVLLYVSKKNLDINIGAALVKSRHGISTGVTTQITDCFRMNRKSNCHLEKVPSETNKFDEYTSQCSSMTSVKTSGDLEQFSIQRSEIFVTHIVDPGEFYIQLSKLKTGTDQFHAKIQETQNVKFKISDSYADLPKKENQQWMVGDHCLVYTKYTNMPEYSPAHNSFEWYRGIVTEEKHDPISETTFSVFLRDIGATIRSIAEHQLFAIDPQLDRVTNAVYRCHLAGIGPAGNAKSWSKSAIDCFRYWITQFETQWVAMRGKRLEGTNSLPVLLWGSLTDTADALAPCIIKYTNISKILVDKGLAYSPGTTGSITDQFDIIEGIDLKEGEITIQKWFKCLEDDITLN
ncbi:uncharacterized protein LOC133336171, partial [Musca vetustissima]|uniref:uncharacterized protein LOC133336171 n=1 Tax=Musca vetustissima TaxID=27455 RepID=UPI002AB77D72